MYTRILLFPLAAIFIFLIACQDKEKPPEQTTSQNPTRGASALETSASDTARAGRYVAAAEAFSKQGKYDSAIVYFEKASIIYKTKTNWEKYVHCCNGLGSSYASKGDYDRAMACLDQALAAGRQHLGEEHAEVGTCYQKKGIFCYKRSRDDEAIEFLNRALKIHIGTFGEQRPEVATSYAYLGRVYTEKSDFDQALVFCNKALTIRLATLGNQHEHVADSYLILGNLYDAKGDLERALATHEKALEIFLATLGEQHNAVAEIYTSLGNDYWEKGDYDKALEFHLKSLSLIINTLGENHYRAAMSYNNIGNLYYEKGDYDQTIAFYKKSLSVLLASVGEQHIFTATAYNNLGIAYNEIGDYEQARQFYEKALPCYLGTVGKNTEVVANLYQNLGVVYGRQGDYTQAFSYFAKALSIGHQVLEAQHPRIVDILEDMAQTYRRQGDYKSALKYFTQTASMKQAIFGNQHPDLAYSYNSLGAVYMDMGDDDSALDFFQRAMRANVPAFSASDPLANPPLYGSLSESTLLESLEYKAQALRQRYAKQSHQRRDLEAAVAAYGLASRLIDQLRTSYKAEGSKLFLAKQAAEIYEQAIATTLQLDRDTAAKETAFQFAEKSKSGLLLETLTEAEARHYAGIPDSLLAKERQLRIDLAFYEQSLAEERLQGEAADSANIALWQDKRFALKQAYENLLQRFEKEYPAYYHLKYRADSVSVKKVQQQILTANTALVEYFTGKDSIFIFAITTNDFAIAVSAKGYARRDSLFEQQIAQMREGIIKKDFMQYTSPAHRLYQALLEPVANKISSKNLIIVPDGFLSAIPFEALLVKAVSAEDSLKGFANLPYLINDRTISYAYSATLLQQEQTRKNRVTKHDYLAFAPVFANGLPAGTRGAEFFNENFASDSSKTATATAAASAPASAAATASVTRLRGYLPSTKKEVTGILKDFENRYGLLERWFGNKSRVYLEKEAKEENLKLAGLGDYRYVHFATHGLVNEKNPKLSGLLLAQEDSTSKEDGILHLGEIYNLNLNADLVVLSACETGLGQIAKGEGIIGLTRGFLYAGASNLLVSLWQVSDATTADLMVDFYDKMLGGMSKPEALREAKLQMIHRHAEYAKPYYWAPFILVGK